MTLNGSWPQLALFVAGMWLVIRPIARRLALRVEARTPIGSADRAVLLETFATLGSDRVARGLAATGHKWGNCFLSLVTAGAPFGFHPALIRGWRTRPLPHLTEDQVRTIVRLWDRKEAAFRAFASEWLGVNTNVSRAFHETRHTLSTTLAGAHAR